MALAVYSVLCHLFRSLDDSVECLVLNTPMAFILQSAGRKVTKTEGLERKDTWTPVMMTESAGQDIYEKSTTVVEVDRAAQ